MSREGHIDFLDRYLEYLCCSNKFVHYGNQTTYSGAGRSKEPMLSFVEAMDNHKVLGALFYINEARMWT